jgi:hypothetical protein
MEFSQNLQQVYFRWLFVVCEALTIVVTWPLWQLHTSPPMLPAVSFLPVFALGIPLLLSLVMILMFPVSGIILHTMLLCYAMLIDQTRMQPEIVSITFLLWYTLPQPTIKTIARAHLITMWFFAGINKLLSPAFLHGTAQWMVSGLIPQSPQWALQTAGYVIALSEITIGALALIPRTRKIAALAAFVLHMGILLDLSPFGHNWNVSVWPWNIALAFAGFSLILPWNDSPVRSFLVCPIWARFLIVLILISPVCFYFGFTDAYLSHNLYTFNTPSTTTTSLSPDETWSAFNRLVLK